jgi:MurNAc alpha-1-phosphate uridylyltransferase
MSTLPVVILGGGLGTRLSALNGEIPKVLTELCKKPFLFWKIKQLENFGTKKIYLLLGKGSDYVLNWLATQDFDSEIVCLVDGDKLLGTAGAIRKHSLRLPSQFILTYGDNLLLFNPHLYQGHLQGKNNTLFVTQLKSAQECFNCLVRKDYVINYSKKFTHNFNMIDYGYSLLSLNAFDALSLDYASDLEIVFSKLAITGNLSAFEVNENYFDIGTPESYFETESWLSENLHLFK